MINNRPGSQSFWLASFALFIASIPVIWLQPLLPIDETRYLAVAWEMWRDQNFIVPHLNENYYSHKPPLYFWLIHAGWYVFGVVDWWARVVSLLAAVLCLWYVRQIALELWPNKLAVSTHAVWLMAPMGLFFLFSSAVMFDVLLLCWTLLASLSLIRLAKKPDSTHWWVLVIAIVLGGLTKGPVMLLHTSLIVGLLKFVMPVRKSWFVWLGQYLTAVFMALAIMMIWIIPAVVLGGPEYTEALLWKQTAGRVVNSFAHVRSWWWYLPLLIPVFLPWSLNVKWWKLKVRGFDPGFQLILLWFILDFALLMMMPTKQGHYLMPLIPMVALLVARVQVDENIITRPYLLSVAGFGLGGVFLAVNLGWEPSWLIGRNFQLPYLLPVAAALFSALILVRQRKPSSIAVLSMCLLISLRVSLVQVAENAQNIKPLAQEISRLQKMGVEVVQLRKYQGQFHFMGQLENSIENICGRESSQWIRENPQAAIITYAKKIPDNFALYLNSTFSYRGGYAYIWSAENYLKLLTLPDMAGENIKGLRCKKSAGYAPE